MERGLETQFIRQQIYTQRKGIVTWQYMMYKCGELRREKEKLLLFLGCQLHAKLTHNALNSYNYMELIL